MKEDSVHFLDHYFRVCNHSVKGEKFSLDLARFNRFIVALEESKRGTGCLSALGLLKSAVLDQAV